MLYLAANNIMGFTDILLTLIMPFLYIVCLTGLSVYVFRKKYNFQEILPLTLITLTLFVFVTTALFNNTSIGFWTSVVAALSFLVLLILDKNRVKFLKENLFTPAFVLFLLLYIFIALLNWSKVVPVLSDSSMHWAPHVRTMWLRDDFYTSPGTSLVIHGDYPPAVQLFELIFSKAAGVYHEGLLFIAIQLLSFSMIFPVFSKFKWRRKQRFRDWLVIFLLLATLISLPLVFFVSDFYSSLDVDTILAFIFAYGLYLAIKESKKFSRSGLVQLSLVVTFLCLTKQVAILLAGIVLLTYVTNLYLAYYQPKDIGLVLSKGVSFFGGWRKHKTTILTILLSAMLPLIYLQIWDAQASNYASPDPGVAIFALDPIDVLQIPDIVTLESGSAAQQKFSRSFIDHLFYDPGGFMLNNISMVSYMQVVLLFVGLMILVWYLYKDRQTKTAITVLASVVAIGWFAYCFAIYTVFLFGGMQDVELNNIDTPNRYVRTYLFTTLLIPAMLLIKKFIDTYSQDKGSRPIVTLSMVLILTFGLFFNKAAIKELGQDKISTRRNEISSLNLHQTKANLEKVTDISDGTFEDPTKILVTATSDKERHYLQYNALPNRVSLLFFEEQSSYDFTCERLRRYEYLVIGHDFPDDKHWLPIVSCLEENVELSKNEIYQIDTRDGGVSLEHVD